MESLYKGYWIFSNLPGWYHIKNKKHEYLQKNFNTAEEAKRYIDKLISNQLYKKTYNRK